MRLLILAAAAALAAVAAPSATAGAPGSYFLSICQFSHRAADDPIVLPRAPGFSHDHSFVGNLSTNAFSTLGSLRKAGTSCTPQADTSAYWAPTLYADGRPVAPVKAAIYYRRLTTAPVRPFPAGLRMVAGNAHAYHPQNTAITYWDCGLLKTTFYGPNGGGSLPITPAVSSTVPVCPPKAEVQLHVNFPDCWDGRRLDSFDHRSHMAYARAGRCPAGHRVAVPALSLVYSYPARAVDAARAVGLSSGGQYTGHADFINAWDQRALAKLVLGCLDSGNVSPTLDPTQTYNHC
jgi:Domain of unknown function (DUF1996)